jgi:hypothetical protein
MRIVPFLHPLVLVLAVALSGCSSVSRRPDPPTVAEIVELTQAGESPEAIVERMRQGRGLYALSGSELAELGAKGVAPEVLDHMLQTHINAQVALERLRHPSPFMFGPGPWGRMGPWGGMGPWGWGWGPWPGYWW